MPCCGSRPPLAGYPIAAWLIVVVAGLVLATGVSLLAPSSAGALPRLEQCENNIDDDGDGKIDFRAEPGCTSPTDSTEVDPVVPAACADGLDNDADGATDFPADSGCRFAAGASEVRTGAPPACANGRDDDRDGAVDFPADPGCNWTADTSEVETACSNGRDDDSDGLVDFPADFGCSHVNDGSEIDPPQCDDGRDNDGDGTLDFDTAIEGQTPDADCESALDILEAPLQVLPPPPAAPARPPLPPPPPPPPPPVAPVVQGLAAPAPRCSDRVDNDGDARIDFPADSGCSSASDDDEAGAPVSQLVRSSATPRLLLPFPIVRLRGSRQSGRVRIRILSVRAPSGSRVSVFCDGARCPRRREFVRVGTRTVLVREFERTMPAGVALRIYVTKPGFVGKYTRFRFRRGRLPLRNDGCSSIAGRSRPCPGS